MPPKTIRLRQFSYDSTRSYFITICTHERRCLLSKIENSRVQLTDIGQLVRDEWNRSFELRHELGCDEVVFMPNHLHAIVAIERNDEHAEAHCRAALLDPLDTRAVRSSRTREPHSISSFVASFKATATRQVRLYLKDPNYCLWQPRFYDRVIRSAEERHRIRAYICDNPLKWSDDEHFMP